MTICGCSQGQGLFSLLQYLLFYLKQSDIGFSRHFTQEQDWITSRVVQFVQNLTYFQHSDIAIHRQERNISRVLVKKSTPHIRVDQICKMLLGIYSNYLIPLSYIRVNTSKRFHSNPSNFRGPSSELKINPKIQRISNIYKGVIFAEVFSIFMI